jgi:hypothetical protein
VGGEGGESKGGQEGRVSKRGIVGQASASGLHPQGTLSGASPAAATGQGVCTARQQRPVRCGGPTAMSTHILYENRA